ncbi:hypothetical protein GCM10010421_40510 [Streptomyces glaucus]|uniref:Uncharacterized protein n=1 Tax=Streptomyces glaucus TaxID=284029 RepID=A0ABN3K0A1_9ACTN
MDLQFVADPAEAEPRAAQGHRSFPESFEVGVLAGRMCHVHTVRAEWGIPGANGVRFGSSRDFGADRCRPVAGCGVRGCRKVDGKAVAGARRLGA